MFKGKEGTPGKGVYSRLKELYLTLTSNPTPLSCRSNPCRKHQAPGRKAHEAEWKPDPAKGHGGAQWWGVGRND